MEMATEVQKFEYNSETLVIPAGRASDEEVQQAVIAIAQNPIVTALLDSTNVWIIVINEERQIVAANAAVLRDLDTPSQDALRTLRLGEAVACICSDDGNLGCGTGENCSDCGVTTAVVKSQQENKPAEKDCLIAVNRNGVETPMEFKVRATPINLSGKRFTVLALQDISDAKRRRVLERIFIHDLNNTLAGLIGWSEFLAETPDLDDETMEAAVSIKTLSRRLAMEVAEHKTLLAIEAHEFKPKVQSIAPAKILKEIKNTFGYHEVAKDKEFEIVAPVPNKPLRTDIALLGKILVNMTKNAFEAIAEGGKVRIGCEEKEQSYRFYVWNGGAIPEDVAKEVFKRYFSTKADFGRGLGAYSMKVFGEQVLGGKVAFTTSEKDGTTFFIDLPIS
ncbi:MAG: HAMP domain-containing histidine kinase [Proteobacteria bacterium]|nr:HAMP domain-containing histidine kinase [Pseudomonadota bacterium]